MKILQHNVSLKPMTSYRIGGISRYYARVQTVAEIRMVLRWLHDTGAGLFVLGKGTNILVSDRGWPGLVMDMTGYSGMTFRNNHVSCRGGARLTTLTREAVRRGLGGIEELAGIPGTVGGACIMNAGAFGQTIADCIETVFGIDIDSEYEWTLRRDQIWFGYRQTSLARRRCIVLGADLLLHTDSRDRLYEVFTRTHQKRRDKQPLDYPNCGSVFKRPEGLFAGTLIEQCGCKGLRIGDAMVSTKHANFIVNVGDATAEDVRNLIAQVQHRVFSERGVLLEPEVLFVGEFDSALAAPK